VQAGVKTDSRFASTHWLPHRRISCSERRLLFKSDLFVVKALTIQHFHGDVTQATEEPVSRRAHSSMLPVKFSNVRPMSL
jgi:hypothetical protein